MFCHFFPTASQYHSSAATLLPRPPKSSSELSYWLGWLSVDNLIELIPISHGTSVMQTKKPGTRITVRHIEIIEMAVVKGMISLYRTGEAKPVKRHIKTRLQIN